MTAFERTRQKIIQSANQRMMAEGIKKTSLEDVARDAGLTRITIYRHFAEKQDLVRAVFMRIPEMLETLQSEMESVPETAPESFLARLIGLFASLPAGDYPARLAELAQVYPNLAEELHLRRGRAVEAMLARLVEQAERSGRLRPGLNRDVLHAYFETAVVNVLLSPSLAQRGLSAADVFQTVQTVFLYGILTNS